MSILKMLNQKGKYHDLDARNDVARYILNPYKVESGLCGEVKVTEDIVGSMNEVAVHFRKTKGVQLRHFILSFSDDEVDEIDGIYMVYEIACTITKFIGQEYQTIFAIHENTDQLHIHFMVNSISYVDGHRYYGTKKDYYKIVNFIKELLHRYGLILQTVSCRSDQDI